jgi:hypothetical protein
MDKECLSKFNVRVVYEDIVNETEKALLFKIQGKLEWIPKSQCNFIGDSVVMIPEWIANSHQVGGKKYIKKPFPIKVEQDPKIFNTCPKCDVGTEVVLKKTGPHVGSIRCPKCNKFMRWISKLEAIPYQEKEEFPIPY